MGALVSNDFFFQYSIMAPLFDKLSSSPSLGQAEQLGGE
jgi:hypothetical protein